MNDADATNPKQSQGASKLPLHLWPTTATALGCLGILEGREKYGLVNWRASKVVATIYVDAAKRHLDAWLEGEEQSPDSGNFHLGNALASIAILVDAQAHGTMVDDRPFTPTAGYRSLIEKLTPHVDRIKALYVEKQPRHFTNVDTEQK